MLHTPVFLMTRLDFQRVLISNYTPGIYAEGYIVFIFPFVCSFVCNSVPFVELLRGCAGSPEPSLLAQAINTIFA